MLTVPVVQGRNVRSIRTSSVKVSEPQRTMAKWRSGEVCSTNENALNTFGMYGSQVPYAYVACKAQSMHCATVHVLASS